MSTVLNEDGTQTSTGRVEIIESPQSIPGQCVLCGKSHSEGGFLNFTGPSLSFDFYGVVIFCRECTASMAREFGFLPPEERKQLESRLNAAEKELKIQRAALVALENAVDSLMALRDVPSRSNVSSNPITSKPPKTNGILPVADFNAGSGASEIDKLINQQGSNDLSESGTVFEITGL